MPAPKKRSPAAVAASVVDKKYVKERKEKREQEDGDRHANSRSELIDSAMTPDVKTRYKNLESRDVGKDRKRIEDLRLLAPAPKKKKK